MEALPVDLTKQATQCTAWFLLQRDLEGRDGQPIYFAVALLWLILQQSDSSSDNELIRLSEWIVSREEVLHRERPRASDRWLLRIARNLSPSSWEWLGRELMRLDLGHRQQLQEWVKLIGSELSGQDGE
jgi:hypothetical protein